MNKTSAQVVLRTNQSGVDVTTMEVVCPRFILAELNTHRVFSRNTASSRAVPFQKMLEGITFTPTKFGKNKPGMISAEDLSEEENVKARDVWSVARFQALNSASELNTLGVHKQWTNRIIEPFMYVRILITATRWRNFFALRCNKVAQPEMVELAYKMLDAYREYNEPTQYLGADTFPHLPYLHRSDTEVYNSMSHGDMLLLENLKDKYIQGKMSTRVFFYSMISAARCARISYLNNNLTPNCEKDVDLAVKLLTDGHMSPFEHVVFSNEAGPKSHMSHAVPFRKLIEGESIFTNSELDLSDIP
jgi:thymidylate synthase ThyX